MNIEEPIGRHFKLKHLIWSNTAKNRSLNNMPGVDRNPSQSKVIKNLKNLMENCIDPIVDVYPNLIINSGYRSKNLNTKIGGSTTSQHCFGQAIDIKVPNLNSADLYNFIYYNVSAWDQLIWEYPEYGSRSWVHVSYNNRRKRRKTTLASDSSTYHNIYGGTRRGSVNQYQDGINDAKIV